MAAAILAPLTRLICSVRGTVRSDRAAGYDTAVLSRHCPCMATRPEVDLAKKVSPRKAATRRSTKRKTVSGKARGTARKKTAARASATRQRRRKPAPRPPSRLKKTVTAARGALAGVAAAVSSRLPGGAAEPDALEILEREHRRFEALLAQGEDTTERAKKARREVLEALATGLNAHEIMEEKVLYPALQSHPEARDVVLEGYQEHHVADVIIKELEAVAADDEQWGAKFKVLKENIEHHIQEEEGEMFRAARGILSREELRDMGREMLALKQPGSTRGRSRK